MNKLEITTPKCSSTMKLLGDYWTLRIIYCLKTSRLRYCNLQRELDNLNPVTLSNRLKKLENAGLVSRTKEPLNKQSVIYSLTDSGEKVIPVIKALDRFSDLIRLKV